MPENKETIKAERRRPGGAPPAGRAAAPSRRRTDGGGSGLPPTSGGGGSPRPSLPGGTPRNLGIGGMLLLLVLFLIFRVLMGGEPETAPVEPSFEQSEEAAQPTSLPVELPTPPPRPTRTASSASSGDTWLVILYQDADDKILEKDIYLDLNEAETVGSSAQVQIVAQIDRYQGGYQSRGDWVSARRYYVTQDDDLERVSSELVEDLGEANMADGDTLVDFAAWAIRNYPADKYALILSDHGMGWPGGWSDPTSRSSDRSLPLARVVGDQIYLHELDQALEEIRRQTGVDKLELIGMDACLMSHLEVLSDLSSHAHYAVTSQETEPALGWAYAAFLEELAANPGMSGAELGEAIVNSYITDDQRIVNDEARADLVGAGQPLNSLFGASRVPSAAQVAGELIPNVTLAAIDLSLMPDLMERFNDLAYTLQEVDPRDVAQARSYAQSFTSIFGKEVPASYIDLAHFAELVGRTSGRRSVGEAANQLSAVLKGAVIAERHGKKRPGATGISIYFPNSALYRSAEAGPDSYTVAAQRFAEASLWDEFLAFHYTQRPFERGEEMVTAPERGAAIKAPAAGGIEVSPVAASAKRVAPGKSIELSSDIRGANIGYIRLLAGFFDQANNSIYVADSDFLASPETRQLNGVYYPNWGSEEFTLSFDWEPIVFAINDGVNSAVTLLNPESYGATAEEATYSVEGIYTFADGSEQRHARLYFSNGQLRQVVGFTGEEGTGAPREITPQRGDTFTILEKWMDLDAQGNVTEIAWQEGETLTFGEEMFTWEQLYAAPGKYIVGFIIEDLDGNSQTTFTEVTVE
jgi:hypothetical protein